MKRLLSLFSLAVLMTAYTFAQTAVTPAEVDENAPVFEWVEEIHDFGEIPQGIPVSHNFSFKNVGVEPLIIKNVQKTCGCTVTDWTKEPIAAGGTGFVEAQFNAARAGAFNKGITVQSNASEPNKKLFFKGTVQEAPTEGSVPEKKSIFDPK